MSVRTLRVTTGVFAGSLLLTGAFALPAQAAEQKADGLVNVQIGDITIQDVNVAVAAAIVANACDLVDVTAAVLAVDTTSEVVPGLVEVEVAVPRLSPALR